MRTLITLLLLACFAWTQATVADCPMAAVPSGQAEHAAASASSHYGHHAPAPAPAEPRNDERHPPSPAQHLASGCGVLAACGAAAAPSASASLLALDAPHADGLAAGRDAYASPTLSFDPPPPRSALRS
ncbi:hypothetical protein [Longimicrobium sp.]|uniref:hypothetical protein n=1 Tax=Longimicrobium sp. TaxID=2029185 RepID=UPI003B3A6656